MPRKSLPPWLWSISQEIKERRGVVELAQCYVRHGVSGRHATAAFKRAVGVTPKRLCRICRLLALLEAIDPSRAVNWTALAHGFGFYDQAHFNHEFRYLAGLYPNQYLEQRRQDLPELGKGQSVPFVPER